MCSVCNNKVIRDDLCCRHLKQTCMICMDSTPITSTNTIKTKRLTCGHSFHTECISEWFITSEDCPVCRSKQPEDDPIIVFKNKVEESMRQKYKDAIASLENEIEELKETLNMQTMFNLQSMFGNSSNVSVTTTSEIVDINELLQSIMRP